MTDSRSIKLFVSFAMYHLIFTSLMISWWHKNYCVTC